MHPSDRNGNEELMYPESAMNYCNGEKEWKSILGISPTPAIEPSSRIARRRPTGRKGNAARSGAATVAVRCGKGLSLLCRAKTIAGPAATAEKIPANFG